MKINTIFYCIILSFCIFTCLKAENVDFSNKIHQVCQEIQQLKKADSSEEEKLYMPLIREAFAEKDLFKEGSKFRTLFFSKEIQELPHSFFDAFMLSSFFQRIKNGDLAEQQNAVELCVEYLERPEFRYSYIHRCLIPCLSKYLKKECYSENNIQRILNVILTDNDFSLSHMKLLEILQLNNNPEIRKGLREKADQFSIAKEKYQENIVALDASIALARWGEDMYIKKVINEFSKIDLSTGYGKEYFRNIKALCLIRDKKIVEFLREELESKQTSKMGDWSFKRACGAAIVLSLLLEDFPEMDSEGLSIAEFDDKKREECIRWFVGKTEYKFRDLEIQNSRFHF